MFCVISCSSMSKRKFHEVKDDEMCDWLVNAAKEAMEEHEANVARSVQQLFYPNQSIPQREQAKAKTHVEAVLAAVGAQKHITLSLSRFLNYRHTCPEQSNELVRLIESIVLWSGSYNFSDEYKRKKEIEKSLEIVETTVSIKRYIKFGKKSSVHELLDWDKYMQGKFAEMEEYHKNKKYQGLRPLSGKS